MRVRYLSGAKQELADAEERYEAAQENLGSEFYEAIVLAIAKIVEHPVRWPKEEMTCAAFSCSVSPIEFSTKFAQVRS